jgi:uncharacterized protein (TIGR02466 family)
MTVHVHIEHIFPTPIYVSSIDVGDINIDHIKCRTNGPANIVNLSVTNDLLLEEYFRDLKSKIDEHMSHFYHEVLGYDFDVFPEMSSSWLVRSLPGQESDWHIHANSLFSGVVYVKADENCGDISFRKDPDITSFLQPPIKQKTIYNHRVRRFNPKTGMLLIFPSNILHKVEINNANFERISIAFNYFVKGSFKEHISSLELR